MSATACDPKDLPPLPVGAAPIALAGQFLALLPEGGLWWPAQSTLLLADLHLEKATALASRGGGFLPPYDSIATLTVTERLVRALAPARIVCLGDSFHDEGGPARLAPTARDLLTALQAGRDWLWIAGNHDRLPEGCGGDVASESGMCGIALRHEADPGEAGPELSGHFHPKARVRTVRGSVVGRCAIEDGRRLILPAFGSLTGGLDVSDPAIAGLFAGDVRVHVLGRRQVHSLPASLAPRAGRRR